MGPRHTFHVKNCLDELMSMVQVEQVKYFLHEYSLFHPLCIIIQIIFMLTHRTKKGVAIIRREISLKVICEKGKRVGKDQESIQSSTTPDPGYHMGK